MKSFPGFCGVDGLHYTNRTGCNDIVSCKVSRDKKNLYFYVRTSEPITSHKGANGMWLLLRPREHVAASWEGFDFIVNRDVENGETTWLETNAGGWNWKRAERIRYRASGNSLQRAIPRKALGLRENDSRIRLDFKWTDNVQHPGDIMDLYVSGDTAPEGRYRYRYTAD